MISMRLKHVLDDIISPVQSAFVPSCMITDNILMAYECMHMLKNKKKGKDGYCDRVEWMFLEKMLIRLDFSSEFVELLMACVKSVKYKVRFND